MGISIPTALLISGGVGAGASLGGAALQSGATTDAAKLQNQTAQQALALQQQMFNTVQGNLAPYRQSGTAALGGLNALLGLPTSPASVPNGQPPASIYPMPTTVTPAGSTKQLGNISPTGVTPATSATAFAPPEVFRGYPPELLAQLGIGSGGGTITKG